MYLRLTLAAMILASLALVPATAQPSFNQVYQVRGGEGDIPSTQVSEPAGTWNLVQTLQVEHDGVIATSRDLFVPAGYTLVDATCNCNGTSQVTGNRVHYAIPAAIPAGIYTIEVTASAVVGSTFGFTLDTPSGITLQDAVVIFYLRAGQAATTANGAGMEWNAEVLAAANPSDARSIHYFATDENLHRLQEHSPFWVTPILIEPQAAGPTEDRFWLGAGLGVMTGIIIWGFLVQRGVVQKRSRKQVATVAAHVEAAKADDVPTLEARKRVLMAGLKELEVAKMNNEVETSVYDAVKADFKKQTVTVMRAIDESAAKKE